MAFQSHFGVNQEQLLIGIILAIVANGLIQLFRIMKGPKEINGELAEELATIRDQTQFNAQTQARHDERIQALIIAINKLTERIDKLEPYMKPGRRGG